MKAVVMSIEHNRVAVLTKDGHMMNLPNKAYQVGDTLTLKSQVTLMHTHLRSVVALAAVVCLLITGGLWSYASPYYTVSLDVNPSLVLTANRYERVIGTKAYTAEAQAILEGQHLTHQTLTHAVHDMMVAIDTAGYFNQADPVMVISTASKHKDKAGDLSQRLEAVVLDDLDEEPNKTALQLSTMGYEMVAAAKALAITPGKYNIITNLLEASVETYSETSIQELMQLYRIKKQGEDHPSVKDEDHPSVKDQDHPSVKDEDHPSVKDEDHPSVKDEDHPSVKPPKGKPDNTPGRP